MLHSFASSNSVAQDKGNHQLADNYYRSLWQVERIERTPVGNNEIQRAGIDVVVHLKSGKKITIDEKFRRRCYEDILLERWGDLEEHRIGWAWDTHKQCDYVAYITPCRQLLIPMAPLRLACKEFEQEICVTANEVRADNGTYTSVSYTVEPEILYAFIDTALDMQCGKCHDCHQ